MVYWRDWGGGGLYDYGSGQFLPQCQKGIFTMLPQGYITNWFYKRLYSQPYFRDYH